ncbi:cytochrome P450 family protein [Karstenula rhodostoma CBS 690.94]|uniref:Cytochrome P450 family protein n=1 Tax=Karstenula rhodostoma CBS 690.94 TaxID=1392251 RepID=A0A9P4PBM3_9PLEO|nr:cytochrome P450 family protein [Karstenula rhodostoma CBS 690.94]
MGSTTALVGAALLLVILHRAYLAIYHLYLSPLSTFPGPKLWAVSSIPYHVTTIRGNMHLRLLEFNKRYGTTVRISPNHIAFTSPQAFKDIYAGTAKTAFPINPTYYNTPINDVHSLLTAPGDNHARQRRHFAPSFSKESLHAQEPVIKRYVDQLMHRLSTEAQTGPFAISDWFNCFTFDLTSELLFSESFDCLSSGRLHPWIALLFGSVKSWVYISAIKCFPALDWALMKMMPQRLVDMQRDHFNLSAAKADRRIELGEGTADLLSPVLRDGVGEIRGEKKLSRDELHSNAYIFIVAGSETTGTALAGITYYLCKTPASMTSLLSEIRSSFASAADITIASATRLPYLTAVIREGLRIYPPFAAGNHRVAPKGGDWVDGHFVPEGTHLYAYHYALYHSPTYFALASEFHPERWLGTEMRFADDQLEGVRPFGLGPRMCIGQNLAWAELRLVLCNMLFRFDVKLRPECEAWIEQDLFYVWQKGRLMVELSRRE